MKTLRTAALLCLSALVLSACAHGTYHSPGKRTVYHQPSYHPHVYHSQPRSQVYVVRQPQHHTTVIRPVHPVVHRAYQPPHQHKHPQKHQPKHQQKRGQSHHQPKHQAPRQWTGQQPGHAGSGQNQWPGPRNNAAQDRSRDDRQHQAPRQQQQQRSNPRKDSGRGERSGREQGGQRQQRTAR